LIEKRKLNIYTCLSNGFIAAPGNDPTSNNDGWDDFFGMFLVDGNVYEYKIKNTKKMKACCYLTSIIPTSLSSGIGINDDNGNSLV
jgi:hypothetical protein